MKDYIVEYDNDGVEDSSEREILRGWTRIYPQSPAWHFNDKHRVIATDDAIDDGVAEGAD